MTNKLCMKPVYIVTKYHKLTFNSIFLLIAETKNTLCRQNCDKCGGDLEQCCPTLLSFATCGDRSFKCGDREL